MTIPGTARAFSRAANWIYVGKTTGGFRDRLHENFARTNKLIFVFPLRRQARQLLRITDCLAPSIEA